MQTYDCEPTLNDSEVLEFCKNGYMLLDRVVPSEINKKVTAWVNEPAGKAHVENYINLDDRYQDLAREQWFKDNVLLNDALTWTIALPMFFRTFFLAISFFLISLLRFLEPICTSVYRGTLR